MFNLLTKSKIQNWLALLLIIGGQLYYFPDRVAFFKEIVTYTQAESGLAKARLAYHPADYDLLAWVEQATPPEATVLLVTASPATYGDPSYVLYHRAIYHLAPRSVWWAAPVPASRYPAWWTPTDLSETDLLTIARQHQATALLADGFPTPPISGPGQSFDVDTHLVFLTNSPSQRPLRTDHRLLTAGRWSLVIGHWSLVLLKLIGAAIVILMWGDLVLRVGTGRSSPPPVALRLAAAWLLGCGVVSLAMFGLLWAGLPLQMSVIGLSVGGIGVWVIVQGRLAVDFVGRSAWIKGTRRTTHHAPRTQLKGVQNALWTPLNWSPLLLLLLAAQIARVAWAGLISPLTDWDGWVNWAGKANLLFIEQALTPNLYHNPARLPTNMDYPLMLPLVEAWFYTWLGRIAEPAVGFISLLFYLALLLLFYHVARGLVSTPAALGFTALLATAPRLERPAHSGLADIPLAALLLLAFLLLHSAYNGRAKRLALLAGLAAGLLPWLKNEGWLWLGMLLLGWVIGIMLPRVARRSHGDSQRKIININPRHISVHPLRISAFLAQAHRVGSGSARLWFYLLAALLIALPWPLFLATYGTVRFTFLPLTPANLWANLPRWPPIIIEMSKRMLNPYWNFIWLFAGLTLLVRRGRIFYAVAGSGWLIVPVAGYLLLISLTYIFSRFDPYLAHLNNSIERLLLQALPLALWWLVGQAVAAGWIKGNQTDV